MAWEDNMRKLKKFRITESTYIWAEDIESVKEIAKDGCEVEEVIGLMPKQEDSHNATKET